ncbi:MAG: beta-N-acetylhexosaminidase [Acidobacteriota bacterium]
MKTKPFVSVLLIFLWVIAPIYAIDLALIPQPVEVKLLEGSLALTSESTVSYNTAAGRQVAEMLARKLSIPTGFSVRALEGHAGTIQLRLNETADLVLGKEGYVLESTPGAVTISANQPAGLFYGMQTLFQLLPPEIEAKAAAKANWTIPAARITDYPRFGWRGLMLDVSRNFFTKDEVKAFIDQASRFKFNTFHWHLTDDHGWRIEIKSLPKLTEVGAWRVPRVGRFGERAAPRPGEPATEGGFYTQADIAEIVRYAQERFVTIVPEIDVPGHSMAAIAAYPELSCRQDKSTRVNPGSRFSEWYGNGTFKMLIENTLNPSDENVYAFLDKVFTEVAALFPSPYIHVGGDECYKGYWKEDPGCQALMKKLKTRHVEDLQGYFLGRVEAIIKAKGKKVIGWDEILEAGLSPETAVMSWRSLKGGIEAAGLGHEVVMSPVSFAYLDYCQGDPTVDPPIYSNLRMRQCYHFEPVPEGVDARYILGGQGNLWTEHVPTLRHVQYMTWPRGWALSEVLWSPGQAKNWESFVNRAERHFVRFDMADINYSRSMYDAIVKTSRQGEKLLLTLDSEAPGLEIYYTLDDTMPDHGSTRYSRPVEVPDAPVTLRVITYRGGKPIGHLITLSLAQLKSRATNR